MSSFVRFNRTNFPAYEIARLLFFIVLVSGVLACAKFSQDVEIIASSNTDIATPENDRAGEVEDYTAQYGAQYALGAPSTRSAIADKLFLGSQRTQPYIAPNGADYESLIAAHSTLNPNATVPIASLDTNATTQWDAGWTGKNINIGIIDTFSDNGTIDTHGDRVALVVNSVAPEANLLTAHSTLTSTDVEQIWQSMNANGYHIINNSFGAARYHHSDGTQDMSFDTNVASWVNLRYKITGTATYNPNMLFVFAAGNSGDYCPDKRIHECTFRAAVVHRQRQANVQDSEAYIWVGALTNDGTALASYSHSAGEMANDFIVAHDDVLAKGDAAGTSYAAPRVSGAAALIRHKFPLLTGFQLKTLLLDTATDIGATGPDPIFGRGKLDLSNALSPQGQLSTE